MERAHSDRRIPTSPSLLCGDRRRNGDGDVGADAEIIDETECDLGRGQLSVPLRRGEEFGGGDGAGAGRGHSAGAAQKDFFGVALRTNLGRETQGGDSRKEAAFAGCAFRRAAHQQTMATAPTPQTTPAPAPNYDHDYGQVDYSHHDVNHGDCTAQTHASQLKHPRRRRHANHSLKLQF